jgi:hypothetical protein
MKIKQSFITALLTIVTLSTTLYSCKPDEHNHDGQETITTLQLKLTPTGGGSQSVFTYKTLNATTTKDTVKLSVGTEYAATLELLDETKSPAANITTEIASLKEEHQFFFIASPSGLIAISNLDKDGNGNNLGLSSTFTTATASTGTLQIVLKHLGNEPKTGNIINGETDLDLIFDVVVQ